MRPSVFNLFCIGLGPSSSHTVGPMKAAKQFSERVISSYFSTVTSVKVTLFGSLALTGKGHHTDKAVLLGLLGEDPKTVAVDQVEKLVSTVHITRQLNMMGKKSIPFDPLVDLVFNKRESFKEHPNGMRFTAYSGESILFEEDVVSIGAGYILPKEGLHTKSDDTAVYPYPFVTGNELLSMCRETGLSIADIMLANECVAQSKDAVDAHVQEVWGTMQATVEKGMHTEGILLGELQVARRAGDLYNALQRDGGGQLGHAEIGMEHNLGLTCDPIKGLVQIPCIERNSMGAVKAVNAARLAMKRTDQKISLDRVIKTMKETGKDMKVKYKETSKGGLALHRIEC